MSLSRVPCLFRHLPSKLNHLTQAIRSKSTVAPIIGIEKLCESLYDEWSCLQTSQGVPWTRFPELTEKLKGHRNGELTILTGVPGSGKTTLLSEMSLDLAESGVRTLWGSFEIKNIRLLRTMLFQFAQTSIDDIESFNYYTSQLKKLPIMFMDFQGEQSLSSVIQTMAKAIEENSVTHVILDNLHFMIGNDHSNLDEWNYQNKIIGEMRRFATQQDVHVTLVIHPRKRVNGSEKLPLTNDSIYGGAKAVREADNVLILQKKATMGGQFRKYLEVTKNRFGGHLGEIPLKFNDEWCGFSRPRDEAHPIKLISRVDIENSLKK